MCGRYNISDDPFVRALMNSLGLNLKQDARRNIAPGAFGQLVIKKAGTIIRSGGISRVKLFGNG